MGCFAFHIGAKKDEHKIVRALSLLSSDSALTDHELNRSGSELTELNSQNVSSASTESSSRRNTFSSASQRASNLRVFTYQELRTATKGFGRSGRLGEGGFGCVYKGLIKSLEDPSTRLEVAVKQLGKRGLQGHKEWVTEVRFLGVVEHQNLVKLLGYCADDDERGIQRLLIYEYMPNGSVEDHLSPRAQKVLSWPMRLKIAQDAARGLAYLHEGMDFQIIFRDFKSSNILLDEQWNAKLSDFGLARLGPPEGATHVSTAVVGTMGYAAPEYIRTGRLTSKSDVWSFGVFLYELITGRRPIDKNQPKSDQKLLDWVKPYLSDRKKFEQIIDPRLVGCYSIRSVYKLSVIANRCLMTQYKSRPKMSSILQMIDALVDSPLTEMAPSKTLLSVPIEAEKKGPKEKENGERRKWFGRVWRTKVC